MASSSNFTAFERDLFRLLMQLWADESVRAAVGEGSGLYTHVQATIDGAFHVGLDVEAGSNTRDR